jgi:hypothetical protein
MRNEIKELKKHKKDEKFSLQKLFTGAQIIFRKKTSLNRKHFFVEWNLEAFSDSNAPLCYSAHSSVF